MRLCPPRGADVTIEYYHFSTPDLASAPPAKIRLLLERGNKSSRAPQGTRERAHPERGGGAAKWKSPVGHLKSSLSSFLPHSSRSPFSLQSSSPTRSSLLQQQLSSLAQLTFFLSLFFPSSAQLSCQGSPSLTLFLCPVTRRWF
ncbi:hypothetical protein VTO42DRAFT_8421 [Malbranchea cinnamomea]